MLIPVRTPSGSPKQPLTYLEFLQTVKVYRMLYGVDEARKYFTENIKVYYNDDNA